MGDVIDSTLMHINKEKAYGRQGKAPTGLIFDPNRLLPHPHPGHPLGWQIPVGGDSWAVKFPGVGTKKEGK